MSYYDAGNLVTGIKTNIINNMPCGCGTLRTTVVRIWHQVFRRACRAVSVAQAVSHRPALRSQLLSKSPADLHRVLSSSRIGLS